MSSLARSSTMRALIVVALLTTSAAASPTKRVTAIPLAGPSSDLEAACGAWRATEVETARALRCSSTDVVDGAKAIARARPFYAEGLDMHCGLAITTDKGVFLPPVAAMFGCGSQRSRSDWDVRQRSLGVETLGGVTATVWIVDLTQTPAGAGKKSVTRSTAVVACRGGDRPACAVVVGDRGLTSRDVEIRWP